MTNHSKPRVSNELAYYISLKRIAAYMDPEKLRKHSEKLYGVTGSEGIEMAYENVLEEARSVIRGKRMPKKERAL